MTCNVAHHRGESEQRRVKAQNQMIVDLRVNGAAVFRYSCVLTRDSNSLIPPHQSLFEAVDASPPHRCLLRPEPVAGLSRGDMWLQFAAASQAS